ncbi:nucleotidyltransferase family protein [bacterium]|nr:nucleotidyltransferase family protein [bacterium]
MKKNDGIILAAGKSRRIGFGKFKMTLPFAGKTIIECAIDAMSPVCDRIIIVGGHRIEEIEKILAVYEKVEIVFNKNYEGGMFTSVKTGASHIEAPQFFLLPGDYPLISTKVYNKMLEIDSDIVIPTYHSRNGHPVLMNSELIPELLAEPDDSNLKIFINRKGYDTVEIDEVGIITDIDTMDDYMRLPNPYIRGTIP